MRFEPVSSAHGELMRVSADDPKWDVYHRCVLGDYEGDLEINISGNNDSDLLDGNSQYDSTIHPSMLPSVHLSRYLRFAQIH